jgi:ABC-type polysaccharide/polyol phosphate export permease
VGQPSSPPVAVGVAVPTGRPSTGLGVGVGPGVSAPGPSVASIVGTGSRVVLGVRVDHGARRVLVGVAVGWFRVPLLGSFWLLFALSVVFLLNTLGLGLFVSTVSDNQQQAMMTSVFFFVTPMIYLSGFVFPIENMPAVIQPITYLIPLRYYLVIVRGIFLKGVGLETLWPQALALLAWGVAILGLATVRSQKTAG